MRKGIGLVGGDKSLKTQSETGTGSFSETEATEQILPSRATRGDQLAYVSDMIGELATLAQRLGCPTLAGILELAQREAHLEQSRA